MILSRQGLKNWKATEIFLYLRQLGHDVRHVCTRFLIILRGLWDPACERHTSRIRCNAGCSRVWVGHTRTCGGLVSAHWWSCYRCLHRRDEELAVIILLNLMNDLNTNTREMDFSVDYLSFFNHNVIAKNWKRFFLFEYPYLWLIHRRSCTFPLGRRRFLTLSLTLMLSSSFLRRGPFHY